MGIQIEINLLPIIGRYGFVTPGIIAIAKYYFFENKTIDLGLILEPRVNWYIYHLRTLGSLMRKFSGQCIRLGM